MVSEIDSIEGLDVGKGSGRAGNKLMLSLDETFNLSFLSFRVDTCTQETN
jgi:hypothetical protein